MRTFLALLLIISLPTISWSQEDTTEVKRTFKEATYVGGGFGFSIRNQITDLSLSPLLGYKIDKKGLFSAGVGVNYRYYNDAFFNYNVSFYGYSVFQRIRPFDNFYTHIEYQRMNVPLLIGNLPETGSPRLWIPALLMGGGYALEIGDNTFLNMTVLYEVLRNPNNYYPKNRPIVGVSIVSGF